MKWTELDNGRYERLFGSLLFHDATVLASFIDDVKPDYFQSDGAKYLIRFLREYWDQYHAVPPPLAVGTHIELDVASEQLDKAEATNVLVVYDEYRESHVDPTDQGLMQYLRSEFGDWLNVCATVAALSDSADDWEAGRRPDLVARFQKVAAVGQIDEAGVPHDLDVDLDRFLQVAADDSHQRVGTGLPELDRNIAGGLRAGELGVFMAPTGKGKSHALVFTGRNAMAAGMNVLHVTLEMDELSVAHRYWAGMVGIDTNEIPDHLEDVRQGLALRGELYPGEVWIQRYPMRSATVNTLRALVMRLRNRGVFDPTMLIIDYADLLLPSGGRRDAAQWEAQGTVYEELRGLGTELGLIVWTATQTNRAGYSAESPGLEMIGTSYAKSYVADVVVSMAVDRERTRKAQQERQQAPVAMRFVAVKVRNGQSDRGVPVLMDGARSTFVVRPETATGEAEVDDLTATLIQQHRVARWKDAECGR